MDMKMTPVSVFWKVTLLPLIVVELLAVFGVLNIQVTYTTFGLLLTSVAVFIAIEVVHRLIRAHHRIGLRWWSVVPVVTATLLDAGGDLFHWYSMYPWFDTALHFFGTFAATAFVWNIVSIFLREKSDLRVLLWATCASGIALGAIYEMEEYLEDFFTASHRLGDGPDTGNDLCMDAIGAILFTLWALWRLKKKRQRK
jgi:hypothetical protein